jgi:16S rRNA (cytosine967-C5)-methyltransferase
MVEQWIKDFGYEKTKGICESFLKERPITIRTNLTKIMPDKLKEKLEAEGVMVKAIQKLSYAFEISGYDYLQALTSFEDGLFYVQDISSMMVAEIAAPEKDNYIIDVCAAPGGKSSHLAEKMEGTGMVESRDLTEYKVSLIEENIERNSLRNMTAVMMDATCFDEASVEKADILICDLPCSGLGVMGKKTDIRYKMTATKQKDLVQLQRQILDTVYPYVKKGGTLVYSTCTIHKEENAGNVDWFVKKYPEFEVVYSEQMFPGGEYHDGFFIAKLKRHV